MAKARAIAAILFVLLAVGCESDPEPTSTADTPPTEAPPSSVTPSESPSPTPIAECPEQAEGLADREALPGKLTGDFDGDARDDEAKIFLFEDAEPGCRAILAVETQEKLLTLPIWRHGAEGGLEQPSPYAMVEINGEPGLEMLVNEAQGASSQFIGAYTILEDGLQMISEEGGGQFGGLFAYGGSVGHLEAVDCVGQARIVITVATPAPGRKAQSEGIYDFERRFYLVEGAELVPDGEEHQRAKFDIGAVPEFGIGPFASCAYAP